MTTSAVVAIDQGTTGTTVLVVACDDTLDRILGRGYCEIPQSYPRPGRVEHDLNALWESVCRALNQALQSARESGHVVHVETLGLTNQRETIALWSRKSGQPLGPAVVWQDRRTAELCRELAQQGHESRLQALTGLVIDPYFSSTKLRWLFENNPELATQAARGGVCFGTIESFLLHKLTAGAAHKSDVSNAARTQLLDIHSGTFSDELCELFRVPQSVLPEVVPCASPLGYTAGMPGLPDGTPITGAAGDQQAALFGQACFEPGQAKCTFGTGSFLLMNTGGEAPLSRNRLLTTIAWRLDETGPLTYAIEGGAFTCGALVQWFRDGLGIIQEAAEIETLARAVDDNGGVAVVPALAGLGAPHWDAKARGTIVGLSRGTTKAHLARAALEALALQSADLVRAMEADTGQPLQTLRVDGGAAANNLLMQLQAEVLNVPVERPHQLETTALGAARLAAVGAGLWPAPPEAPGGAVRRSGADRAIQTGADTALKVADETALNTAARKNPERAERFEPTWDAAQRKSLKKQWQRALARAKSAD